jgi:hypothetical protein
LQHLLHTPANLFLRPALDLRDQSDIPLHREMRKKARLLYDVPNASPQPDHVDLIVPRAIDQNLPRGRRGQPVHQFQSCRFARAAAPQKYENLPVCDPQIEVAEHLNPIHAIGNVAEFDHESCKPLLKLRSAYRTSMRAPTLRRNCLYAGFAMHAAPSDNRAMEKNASTPVRGEPFTTGALVIATLSNPREKFWGMILALAPEGLSLSGAELASFEDLTLMVRDGEPFTPAVVFFPMHRIERVELDLPDGTLPSLSQRFLSKTGLEPSAALAPRHESNPYPSKEPA